MENEILNNDYLNKKESVIEVKGLNISFGDKHVLRNWI